MPYLRHTKKNKLNLKKCEKKQKIQLPIQLFEEQNMAIKDWIHEVSLSSFIILLLYKQVSSSSSSRKWIYELRIGLGFDPKEKRKPTPRVPDSQFTPIRNIKVHRQLQSRGINHDSKVTPLLLYFKSAGLKSMDTICQRVPWVLYKLKHTPLFVFPYHI